MNVTIPLNVKIVNIETENNIDPDEERIVDATNTGLIFAYYNIDNKIIYFALTNNELYDTITFNADFSHMFSNGKTKSEA